MKLLAIGFLFALLLSVTLAMTLNARNVPEPGFRPEDGSASCHGGGRHGGHSSRPSTDSSDASTTTGATVTTAST